MTTKTALVVGRIRREHEAKKDAELAALRARVAELEAAGNAMRRAAVAPMGQERRDAYYAATDAWDALTRDAGNKPAQRIETCVQCAGSGKVYGSRGYEYRCEVCDGSGRREIGVPDSAPEQ